VSLPAPDRPEQLASVGRGITLCFESIGDPAAEPLLLVAGLGQQLNSWPIEFCETLAARGYRVIRFDNRDVGRSTHLSYRPPNPVALLTGRMSRRQYHLGDLARDTVGLLDALGLRDAHVVGVSMGGMIAQTVAAHFPGRARTLTSIMSTTGAPKVGRPAPSTWRLMMRRPATTRADAVEASVRIFRLIGSHGFPFDEPGLRAMAGEAWDRDPSSAGAARQLAAIFASGDRTAELRRITVPTLVIHGDRDRMVNPTGGTATVRAIPGAVLRTIPGMGHDLPIGAWPRIIDLIDAHARTAAPTPPRSDHAPITT
jgi:pimeloyl-ACP methyl ester carboxylesterase